MSKKLKSIIMLSLLTIIGNCATTSAIMNKKENQKTIKKTQPIEKTMGDIDEVLPFEESFGDIEENNENRQIANNPQQQKKEPNSHSKDMLISTDKKNQENANLENKKKNNPILYNPNLLYKKHIVKKFKNIESQNEAGKQHPIFKINPRLLKGEIVLPSGKFELKTNDLINMGPFKGMLYIAFKDRYIKLNTPEQIKYGISIQPVLDLKNTGHLLKNMSHYNKK